MKIYKAKGFTLIELMLYIAISSIIILGVSATASILFSSRIKTQSVLEVEQQGQLVMEIMGQTIRNADDIVYPSLSTASSSLSVSFTAGTSTPTLFYISGGILKIKKSTNTESDLTNDRVVVSNLKVHNLSRTATPGILSISFNIKYNNLSSLNEYDYNRDFVISVALRQP